MLVKFYLDKAHTVNMPIKKMAILKQKTEKKALLFKRKYYQDMTESIIFFIVETRPNITFATSIASCFAKNFSHQQIKVVKIIPQYLKSSKNRGITYRSQNKLKIKGYSDFN